MTVPAAPSRRALELGTLLGTGVIILVADQVTKGLVVANVAVGQRIDVLGDLLQVWHAENSGAAFSLLQNGLPLFIAVSILALVLVVYFARTLRGRSPWYFLILGLVLGGTLGNFTDRLAHGGRVTDFISFGFGDTRFATFNVADASLSVGITLVVITLWLFDRSEQAPKADGRQDGQPTMGETRGDGPAPGAAG